MKKSLAILLSICLVLTTIYGCFVITASAEPEPTTNLWEVAGGPDLSGMDDYGTGFFSGEGSVPNGNYIYGQDGSGNPKYSVSTYGWRGYGLSASAGQRAARMDNTGGVQYDHLERGGAYGGLIAQFTAGGATTRAVSRQIQLQAGKNYTLSFWFTGQAKGFDIKALSAISNVHESSGTSVITAKSHAITASGKTFSTLGTWTYVSVDFTMPNDKSVANIILCEGYDCTAGFDDFMLIENLFLVSGAPEMGVFGAYNGDFFSGEFSSGSWNKNYILGQNDNGTPKATQNSPYGWRGYGLQAEDNHCAARYDYGSNYYYSKDYDTTNNGGSPSGFKFKFSSNYTGKLSRQIQLEAGESYTLEFWFKGYTKGFSIQALDAITTTHQNTGDSIITSKNYDITATSSSDYTTTISTGANSDTWADVKYTFTMPDDQSVVNIIFGEGSNFNCAFDDFKLYKSPEVYRNEWAVDGAPDQCGMEPYGTGFFSGEFTSGGNVNYIYGQRSADDTTPIYNVSTYGWRGYLLAASANQRAARMDNSGGIYCNKNGTAGLMVQLKSAKRAASRQIQLKAGKSYSLSFWFKGVAQGFDITALDQIYNYHVAANDDSIITSMSANIRTSGNAFSTATNNTWEYVTVTFTMPANKSVANFILGEGSNVEAIYDDFELYRAPAVVAVSTDIDFTGMDRPYPSFTGGNTASASIASATEGDTVTLTATPASDFSFDGWYLGGSKVSSNASYTATIETEGNFVAKFAPTATTNYWEGGDMESISPKYSYLGSNITNGENEDGWITVRTGNYSPVRAVPDNTVSYNSSTSLKLDFSGAVRGVGKRLKLTNGNAYTISFYYKGGGNGFGVYNHNSIDTTLVCNDVDNGLRAMSTANEGPAAELVYDTPRGSDWRQYSYTFTLSAGDYVDIVWTSASAAYLDDVTVVPHTHVWGDLVPETPLSCDSDGHYAYYYCEDCGSYKNTSGVVVPWSEIGKGERPAHDLTHHAAVAATCTAAGNIEYWSCATCGKNYSEEACENVIEGSVVIAALGHDYTVYAYQAPTCTVDGHTAYKVCSRCSQVVDGSDNVITIESTVLPHFHGNAELLTYHAAVAPTVDIDGNVAYYTCPGCSDYSLDVNFTEAGGSSFFNEYIKLTVDAPVEYGNLSFDGDIGLSIALDIDGYHLTAPKLVVRSYYGDNSEKVTELTSAQLGSGAGALANFNMLSTGLDASQIANDIVIELYDGDVQVDEFHDGESTWVTSIKDVLEQYINIYKSNDDDVSRSLVTFCKTTLTYGAAAQDYFGTIASVRADENYSVDISGISAGDITASRTYSNNHIGIKVKSASFFATSQSAVRFYVDFEDDSTIEDYTFEATMGGQSLASLGARTNSGFRATDGTPYFEVKDIPARHLNKMINITIKRSGSVALTASYNALVYVKGWLSYTPSELNPEPENYEALLVLCKGIYAMSEAAEDYFEMVD